MWLILICGILLMLGGVFVAFAGGMSDAPAVGESYGRKGGIAALIGLVVTIGSTIALILR
jgi:hypothetical protein